jgi:hypothetical protein
MIFLRFSKRFFLIFSLILFLNCNLTENDFTPQEICFLLDKITVNDQKHRVKLRDNSISEVVKDSLRKLIRKDDIENTEILIKIINQIGWPKTENMFCEISYPTVVIFRHAPEQYFDTIKKLIDIELEKGNIDGLNHAFIQNHLEGRPAFFKVIKEQP